ncbi:diphosphomevalonate decarboxylase [Fructobacillus ficulneus]|uniref:diphosphomevalonate decarboxylase n=1 Tax=Fructobacillus ficulneus TaxID=157463 RepID=A0A0K8MJ15_9LACO|nr:diphosphomevalonate decarboxylase [Fructobacillus ficulneus]GAP00174.1 diphosphomevalonate decarboxylase [Fructobacillus ficulneus]
MNEKTSTARAHTNIALMKYWGKKDAALNLPTTSSLSLTLKEFYTDTMVTEGREDTLLINNLMQDPTRVHKFLDFLRAEKGDFPPLTVVSKNVVPTSAGLASSASSFAALTAAVAHYNDWDLSLEELSRLARRGSGSATRSFFPGFAVWHEGHDDQSSFAESLPESTMPIALVVCEVAKTTKKVSSSDGMQRAMTSPDYEAWVAKSHEQFDVMQAALAANDLETVGAIAEENALAMHALNMSATDRRFTYFSQMTIDIIAFVKELRKQGFLAYATIDAGPNVKIITRQDQAEEIKEKALASFRKLKVEIATPGPGLSYIEENDFADEALKINNEI